MTRQTFAIITLGMFAAGFFAGQLVTMRTQHTLENLPAHGRMIGGRLITIHAKR